MTAVEFLEQELDKNFEIKGNSFLFDKILKQAKEMEKEQIINAALYGFRQDSDGDDWQGDNYNAEQYYNETSKSE